MNQGQSTLGRWKLPMIRWQRERGPSAIGIDTPKRISRKGARVPVPGTPAVRHRGCRAAEGTRLESAAESARIV